MRVRWGGGGCQCGCVFCSQSAGVGQQWQRSEHAGPPSAIEAALDSSHLELSRRAPAHTNTHTHPPPTSTPTPAPARLQVMLTSLDLSHAYVEDHGARLLAHALHRNQSLIRLALPHNRLTSASAVGFASALRTNATLTQVSVCAGLARAGLGWAGRDWGWG